MRSCSALELYPVNGESAKLLFYVEDDVSFDYVNLEILDSGRNRIRAGPDVCTPDTPFSGGFYNCTIHALRPDRDYFLRLQGHDPTRNDTGSGGTNDGLSKWSFDFAIRTGQHLSETCINVSHHLLPTLKSISR